MAQIDPQFLARMAQQLIGIAGKVIAVTQSEDGTEDIKKIQDKHYEASMRVAKKIAKQAEKEHQQVPVDLNLSEDIQKKYDASQPAIDMTEERVQKGTACNACSRDHLSVASGLLDEAANFAIRPGEGLRSKEVSKRVFKALKEITNMERVDLAPDAIANLTGKEKELALWARNIGSTIRHDVTAVKSPDDLLKVAAFASKSAEKFSEDVWSLTLDGSDGGIDKRIDDICRGLSGEALKVCRERVSAVIESRK